MADHQPPQYRRFIDDEPALKESANLPPYARFERVKISDVRSVENSIRMYAKLDFKFARYQTDDD